MESLICIDLDETLVFTTKKEYSPKYASAPGVKPIVTENGTYLTFLRSHTREFLDACKAKAHTVIFTSGSTEFQTEVLRQHGITDIPVYGREDHNKLPKAKKTLLIDDLHVYTMGMQSKLQILNPELPVDETGRTLPDNDTVHLLNVRPWGEPKSDQVLKDLIPTVQNYSLNKAPEIGL